MVDEIFSASPLGTSPFSNVVPESNEKKEGGNIELSPPGTPPEIVISASGKEKSLARQQIHDKNRKILQKHETYLRAGADIIRSAIHEKMRSPSGVLSSVVKEKDITNISTAINLEDTAEKMIKVSRTARAAQPPTLRDAFTAARAEHIRRVAIHQITLDKIFEMHNRSMIFPG